MIKNKLKSHSMGVLTKMEPNLFRPIPLAHETRPPHRWVLNVPHERGVESFYIRMDGGIRLSTQNVNMSYNSPSNYFMGGHSWDPIKFKVIDVLNNSNPDYFREWMMSHTEMFTGRMAYASNIKRDISLEKIDPVGNSIEFWRLYGAMITEMRHEVVMDREMSDMEITINFDKAILL